jgi:hypothetical protein
MPIELAPDFAELPFIPLAEGITDELLEGWENYVDPYLEPVLALALGYAEKLGWDVFPANTSRDAATGKLRKKSYKSAARSNGAAWGKTRDPDKIRRDFRRWPDANVGIPTGKDNGFWVIEADTLKGHDVDGIGSLRMLEEKHGKLPDTLMAESPSGSLHHYFSWPDGSEIRNGTVAPGVDIKGEGGMVIAPPSVRDDGEYRWLNNNPIADAPQWLLDLVTASKKGNGPAQRPPTETAPEFEFLDPHRRLAEGIPETPPRPFGPIKAECGWLRHVHDSGGEDQSEVLWWDSLRVGRFLADGEKLIHEFSHKYPKYTFEETEAKFEHVCKDKEALDLGWPQCKTICDHGSVQCKSCPHLAEGGSPLHHGRQQTAEAPAVPRDLWAKFDAPPLPTGLLPEVIEQFAFAQAELMGCDPAGIAMGALTVCAAAIPDEIKLQVKRYDPRWVESTRLWTGLVGLPSTMKSPIMLRAIEPLNRIDKRLTARYMEAMASYEKLSPEDRKKSEKPKLTQTMLGDTTPEAAQIVLQNSPNGVLLFRDELSGWFGSMDKYSGSRGAAADRAFWLCSYNGGRYLLNRVGRGASPIPNLSVSMLGGIQIEPLRALVAEGVDDGLIQRMLPIMLRAAVLGKDEPLLDDRYDNLVERLNQMISHIVFFDDAAQQIRRELEQKHIDLMAFESVNKKLAAHIGKYNGLFARLCLLWHCIENVGEVGAAPIRNTINADTAQRVADFLHGFLLPHAISFYVGVVGLADDHDRLANVAGYILAHKLERITNRDVARGDRSMRKLDRADVESIFNRLDALGWISRVQGYRSSEVQWVVNPQAHRLFEQRAKAEAERRQHERTAITLGYEVMQRRAKEG